MVDSSDGEDNRDHWARENARRWENMIVSEESASEDSEDLRVQVPISQGGEMYLAHHVDDSHVYSASTKLLMMRDDKDYEEEDDTWWTSP